jgi:hypothetical protein
MSLLALFALLAFLLGVALLLSVMWLLRAAGALGRPMAIPPWLPLTLSGAFERWGDSRTVCAARRDPVYHGANLTLVGIGTLGIALFSASAWLNLALAMAYLGSSVVFFLVIYVALACQSCYYVREAHTPLPEYRATEERAFKLRYRSAILTWCLLVWVCPMTLMAYGAWELERTIELPLLAAMTVFAATVFVPVLALRVCDGCRINTLGMCPMPWKNLVSRSGNPDGADSARGSPRVSPKAR